MIKLIAAGLAAFVLLLAGIAWTATEETHAGGTPTDTPTTAPTDTPTAAPTGTATATPTAAATGTGTATATGTPTATAVQPAAAPQTGGEPGDGSDTLLLTLMLGAAAIIGAGGVIAGKYALERRSS
jgi:hypothetical protein